MPLKPSPIFSSQYASNTEGKADVVTYVEAVVATICIRDVKRQFHSPTGSLLFPYRTVTKKTLIPNFVLDTARIQVAV